MPPTGSGELPRAAAALLGQCDAFRSLDDHAERICRRAALPPQRAATVRRYLEELAATGLLTAEAAFIERLLAQGTHERPLPPIGILGVPSRDRPDSLARSLRSYGRNSRDYGRDVEFVVIDDSRSDASREANRASLRALRREYGVRVSYAGAIERESYGRTLARASGVPLDIVRFGLLGLDRRLVSTGASRNALLLHAVGDRFIHIDDDTLCNVAAAPGARPGLAIESVQTSLEHAFFATHQAACAAVSFADRDYFGLYEEILGYSVADVLARSDGPLDLERLLGAFAAQLQRDACRVAVVTPGVVGDSGMGSTEAYFFTPDRDSLARVLAFPGGHRQALETHHVVRTTRRHTVAQAGLCMGINLGLDGSAALPPFMPVLRNSDGIFGNVRRMCLPETVMAFLPYVVEHQPPSARRSSFESVLRDAGRVPLSVLLSWFIKTCDTGGTNLPPEVRLEALGRHLTHIGSLRLADYSDVCRCHLSTRLDGMAGGVVRLDGGRSDRHRAWNEDLATYLTAAQSTLRTKAAVVPLDLERAGMDSADAIECGQRLVRRYGDLLSRWPAVLDSARKLRERDVRVAVPVL
jgi:hypothetical protein